MSNKSVSMFIDYENIRLGLWKNFQKRVPGDIEISSLLDAFKQVAQDIGNLYEAYVFGDWTLRAEDARAIERTPQFRTHLVLRSDSKKDRTDPTMNFAIDDFYREKPEIDDIVICAVTSSNNISLPDWGTGIRLSKNQ